MGIKGYTILNIGDNIQFLSNTTTYSGTYNNKYAYLEIYCVTTNS